jgi:predicted dehydrogenase
LPRKIRLAMIGLEGHPGTVLDALPALPDVELAAFYDPDPKRGRNLKARRYDNWRELLTQEHLDVVGVAGSHPERTPAILAAAERKLHIASEKPLAFSREDLNRVKVAVASNQVGLTMFLPMRFYGSYSEMHRMIAEGAIGEVAQIDAQKSYKLGERAEWMRHRDTFGGTIPYIGVHMVDLMRFTTGRELTQAFSMQNRIGHPDMQDMENTTATVFRLDNGGVSVLHMDYLRPETAPTHGDDRLRVAGTKGVIEFQETGGLTLVTDREKLHTVTPLPENRNLFVDFLDAVYNGKPAGLPLEDIYRVNEIVLGARESAETGKVVKT